ncbi:cytochrome-c peroxidase [Asaia krungthepensis]|uniref:Di-heme cytochrome c peroxidase n=1 Tax=Asaia krungthepensis NRIC 0535 TaxID=1307925 RepID=A0ABQ0Q6W9_9PROT|nr:cytochrome c peroxidase [Asaia krungthepensis]GBQ93989.1 di-heme cytochrome c peroxidase [Asaia krungthepensis NRIC 0535]
MAVLFLGLMGPSVSHAQVHSCQVRIDGSNPCPVRLVRPEEAPLSAMAMLGKALFFDTQLSGSGRLSCASCHVPAAHYAPDTALVFAQGGQNMDRFGVRAVPSLTYRERQPPFSVGPDNATSEAAPPAPPPPGIRNVKSASDTGASALAMVPQGGLFWDGRADTLQSQAEGPLFDPREMAATPHLVAERLRHAPYSASLFRLIGAGASDKMLTAEALFALARYQIEAKAFHPYSSHYDDWLEGKARLSPEEAEGMALFNNPSKGNCAACHLSGVDGEGRPPLFTDHQYEALAAPRQKLSLPGSPDLGLCAAGRADIGHDAAYCGFFRTPSLRNAATRHVFFHNGVFTSLRQVMDFYVLRDIEPERFYPRRADGTLALYDDLPPRYWANIDKTDAPFGPRHSPALTPDEREKIIAFLGTLTDR